MCDEATIRELIRGHIGAAVDQLNIIRIRAYTHHSRVAARFVQGRVALVGDAAHISPPWAGQGLNSGLRDVANVAWKLAAIIQGRAAPSILASYDQERRGHATELVALADNMGAVLGLTNPLMAGVRDWLFQAVNSVDNLRSHLLEFKFKPQGHHHPRPGLSRACRAARRRFGRATVRAALTSKMPRANVGASTTCWATRMPCWVTAPIPGRH
jgi:3-(3-hydroxy-phenyl)propionate hydroxylase